MNLKGNRGGRGLENQNERNHGVQSEVAMLFDGDHFARWRFGTANTDNRSRNNPGSLHSGIECCHVVCA